VQAARTDAPACLAAQPSRRGWAYTQPYRRDGVSLSADGTIEIAELASLGSARSPVIAGAGLELPASAPRAVAVRGPAEALLALAGALPDGRLDTLVPLYVEAAPAQPPRSA
jgi:hypothetical protein